MPATSPASKRPDVWAIVFVGTLACLLVAGLALSYLGVGARLSRERTIDVKVRAENIPNETAHAIAVGDPVYTEPGGMPVGRVTAVKVRPQPVSIGDAAGTLHTDGSPVLSLLEVTFSSPGREGEDLVMIANQAVSVGHWVWVYTDRAFLQGVVVGIDVR